LRPLWRTHAKKIKIRESASLSLQMKRQLVIEEGRRPAVRPLWKTRVRKIKVRQRATIGHTK
jgi:hypothetical protein